MDLKLPGMQGEEVLARLRMTCGPLLPAVVVSVRSLEPTETLALQRCGVTAILVKGAGADLVVRTLVAEPAA